MPKYDKKWGLRDTGKIEDLQRTAIRKGFKILENSSLAFGMQRYLITFCPKQKFLYYHVPKAATRTIRQHLAQCGDKLDMVTYPLLPRNDYFKFSFVRNPWRRLLSCWKNKIMQGNFLQVSDDEHKKMHDFSYFVDYVASLNITKCNPHIREQSSIIDLSRVDFIGRIENMEKDLKTVMTKLNIPFEDMKHVGATPPRPLSEMYNDMLAEKVYKIYERDITIFGYEFN